MGDYTTIDVEQRTLEWHRQRLGMIGSTSAKRALGRVSTRARLVRELRYELELRERMTGIEDEEFLAYIGEELNVDSLTWGRDHEDAAVAALELAFDQDFDRPGMLSRTFTMMHPPWPALASRVDPDETVGTTQLVIATSPDAMLGDVPVEIKCPINPDIHIRTYTEGPWAQHSAQLTHHALVSGSQRVLFASFDPREAGARKLYHRMVEVPEADIINLRDRCIDIWRHVIDGTEPEAETRVPKLF